MPKKDLPVKPPRTGTALTPGTVEPTKDLSDSTSQDLLAELLEVPKGVSPLAHIKRTLFVSRPAGRMAAARLFMKHDRAASDLLHYRAKAVLRDMAAMLVPAHIDELQKKEPNSARLNAQYRLLRAVGIINETAPIAPHERDKDAEEAMELAGLDREQLAQRVLDRLRKKDP